MIKESLDRFAERFAIPVAFVAIAVGTLSLQHWQGETLPTDDGVVPKNGVELPVIWGDLEKRLVDVGVIDREKWLELYGNLTDEEKRLLEANNPERLRITQENAPYLLNLLWAFGLANENPILKAEMEDPAYGGAVGFASTGGWTLSKGDPMNHYGAHALVTLTSAQQVLVERVSRGIYRPCCNNSTHFPDCNHGMAMLGFLELMAAQGASEEEMYKAALAVNSYWFPDTYRTIATYMRQKGIEWSNTSPKEVLGRNYSSASGYQNILSKVQGAGESSASCGV